LLSVRLGSVSIRRQRIELGTLRGRTVASKPRRSVHSAGCYLNCYLPATEHSTRPFAAVLQLAESSICAVAMGTLGRIAEALDAEAADHLARLTSLRNARKSSEAVRPLEIAMVITVGLCVFASRAARPGERWTRARVSAPIRLARSASLQKRCQSSRATGVTRLRGSCSDGAFHQALGLAFQFKSRILM
jgi:hypothetical protein